MKIHVHRHTDLVIRLKIIELCSALRTKRRQYSCGKILFLPRANLSMKAADKTFTCRSLRKFLSSMAILRLKNTTKFKRNAKDRGRKMISAIMNNRSNASMMKREAKITADISNTRGTKMGAKIKARDIKIKEIDAISINIRIMKIEDKRIRKFLNS